MSTPAEITAMASRKPDAGPEDRSQTGKPKAGKFDPDRIRIDENYELAYWATHLGVTTAALTDAVAAVGARTEDVKRYLARERARDAS
jgi:hypothetical protein